MTERVFIKDTRSEEFDPEFWYVSSDEKLQNEFEKAYKKLEVKLEFPQAPLHDDSMINAVVSIGGAIIHEYKTPVSYGAILGIDDFSDEEYLKKIKDEAKKYAQIYLLRAIFVREKLNEILV